MKQPLCSVSPRCFSYHAYSAFGSSARRNAPPIPVTLAMRNPRRQPTADCSAHTQKIQPVVWALFLIAATLAENFPQPDTMEIERKGSAAILAGLPIFRQLEQKASPLESAM